MRSTAVIEEKFGKSGLFNDQALFAEIYKDDYGKRYLAEAAVYSDDVIACARDICTYIYETHGRFPAHCDAIHVPGVWLQAHHVETGLLRPLFPQRRDRGSPQPSSRLARVRLFESAS